MVAENLKYFLFRLGGSPGAPFGGLYYTACERIDNTIKFEKHNWTLQLVDSKCVHDLTDDCDPNPCGGGGKCVDEGFHSYSCICSAGYVGGGLHTPCSIDYSDDCTTSTCSSVGMPSTPSGGTGTCEDLGVQSFRCSCDAPSFSARNLLPAQTRQTMASLNSPCFVSCSRFCGEGAISCNNLPTTRQRGRPSAQCECNTTAGYVGGEQPEIPCSPNLKDDCLSNPCGPGGICEDSGVKSYFCTCKIGYIGGGKNTACTVNLSDDCKGERAFGCGDGGTCADIGATKWVCDCKSGYIGGRTLGPFFGCSVDLQDDCISNPCGLGGVCIDQGVSDISVCS
eukprot:COSAG01_NODE_1595_length_9784_cov_66.399380_2_plen_338_part_00